MSQYHVYIMANRSKTLYAGVTSDLQQRVYEHKQRLANGFTTKYNTTKLVYYEVNQWQPLCHSPRRGDQRLAQEQEDRFDQSVNPEWEGFERRVV